MQMIEWVYSNDRVIGANLMPSHHFIGRNNSESGKAFKRRVLEFKRELDQGEKMADVLSCEGM